MKRLIYILTVLTALLLQQAIIKERTRQLQNLQSRLVRTTIERDAVRKSYKRFLRKTAFIAKDDIKIRKGRYIVLYADSDAIRSRNDKTK